MTNEDTVPETLRLPLAVPEGTSGAWRIERFHLDEAGARETRVQAWMDGTPLSAVPPGDYVRLMRDDVVVMSNTPMEILTHLKFMRRARGDILINGLGLGMALTRILDKPEVTSVTVIEASADVINLVGAHYAKHPKVTIIQSDAFTYTPEQTYDCVWHDIWDTIGMEHLPAMDALKDKYRGHAKWQGCWGESQARKELKTQQEHDSLMALIRPPTNWLKNGRDDGEKYRFKI